MDVSEQQISKAPKSVNNITFSVSAAEDLSTFNDDSLDLVTIAQAFHWVDQDRYNI